MIGIIGVYPSSLICFRSPAGLGVLLHLFPLASTSQALPSSLGVASCLISWPSCRAAKFLGMAAVPPANLADLSAQCWYVFPVHE